MASKRSIAMLLWSEEDGFIVSAELVLLATILVLALIVGLTAVRESVTAELVDIANAFGHANQSFHAGGHGHGSFDNQPHQFQANVFVPAGHD